MKKHLSMLCGVVAAAIGASEIVNALQAGRDVHPLSVFCVIIGVVCFVVNETLRRATPSNKNQ
ncbi:hypothetical protein [Paraburkholderia tropica]|uniref:hypothetical protein n=1 Tax=Paraburkholderia tropica TaxID=92647 RepID=UPI001CC79F86|nr:hypothetical protein [Paraburkholderia tropica]